MPETVRWVVAVALFCFLTPVGGHVVGHSRDCFDSSRLGFSVQVKLTYSGEALIDTDD